MVDLVDLNAERWGRSQDPTAYKPADALEAMLRDIRAGKLDVRHVVLIAAVDEGEKGLHTHYYQAGEYGYHAQVGLVERAAHMMKDRS